MSHEEFWRRKPPEIELIDSSQGVIPKFEVKLGGPDGWFVFDGLEVPSDLVLGGTQMRAVHQFPGGARTIDVYGSRPRPIEFHGQLMSVRQDNGEVRTAMMRMAELDAYRRQGKVLTLTFGPFKYQVLVSDFRPVLHHVNHVSFTLVMDVLSEDHDDLANWAKTRIDINSKPGEVADRSLEDLLNLLTDAVNTVAALATVFKNLLLEVTNNPTGLLKKLIHILPVVSPFIAAGKDLTNAFVNAVVAFGDLTIATVQVATDLNTANPVSTLDPSEIATTLLPEMRNMIRLTERVNAMVLLGPARAVQIASQQPVSSDMIMSGAATVLSPVSPDVPPLGMFNPEAAAFAATMGTAMLAQARNFVRRVATMAGLTAPNEIVTVNPNLYAIAAAVYGTPAMWHVIAEANCLKTPLPEGVFDGKLRPKLKVPITTPQDVLGSTRPVR